MADVSHVAGRFHRTSFLRWAANRDFSASYVFKKKTQESRLAQIWKSEEQVTSKLPANLVTMDPKIRLPHAAY